MTFKTRDRGHSDPFVSHRRCRKSQPRFGVCGKRESFTTNRHFATTPSSPRPPGLHPLTNGSTEALRRSTPRATRGASPMSARKGRKLHMATPQRLLKEFYYSTPSRYPAGHAQEPSRPNAPGRNLPSRNPEVTGRDLLPPGPRTPKPRGKRAGSTNRPGTGPWSAGSTGGATLRNRDRGPSSLASARNVASRPYRARHAASAAPRPTGSPAGAAMPSGGQWPDKRQRRTEQTSERGTGYKPGMTTSSRRSGTTPSGGKPYGPRYWARTCCSSP